MKLTPRPVPMNRIALRPALALTMLAGIVAGIAAFITGLLAILWGKERALLVYASSVIGAFLILFLAGEILFPHWGFGLIMEATLRVLPPGVGDLGCLFAMCSFLLAKRQVYNFPEVIP